MMATALETYSPPREKDHQYESKYEDNSFFPIDGADGISVGCRIRAAKTNYGLCTG